MFLRKRHEAGGKCLPFCFTFLLNLDNVISIREKALESSTILLVNTLRS